MMNVGGKGEHVCSLCSLNMPEFLARSVGVVGGVRVREIFGRRGMVSAGPSRGATAARSPERGSFGTWLRNRRRGSRNWAKFGDTGAMEVGFEGLELSESRSEIGAHGGSLPCSFSFLS